MQNKRAVDLLCDIQADLFELSAIKGIDSKSFIIEWSESETAKNFDLPYDRTHWLGDEYLLAEIEDENGKLPRGGENWGRSIMRWMGWMYRLISIKGNMSSHDAVRLSPPEEMLEIYPGYHTLDYDMAVERIFEAKEYSNSLKSSNYRPG